MNLVSLNVGRPRLLSWKGATFSTGIFKAPVSGRVMLRSTNLDDDRQADLSVHGGPNKAAYGYPSEHYTYWREQLPGHELPWGSFGENFTTAGLLESDICVGDHYRAGSAVIAVTTPRLPCFKLAAKFQRDDMIERFLHSGRSGYYFSVVEEGEVGAGDDLKLLERPAPTLTIAEMADLYTSASPDVEVLQRALQVTAVPQSWRERFLARLAVAAGQGRVV
jgi:MOSC domain-containing protein YiiM